MISVDAVHGLSLVSSFSFLNFQYHSFTAGYEILEFVYEIYPQLTKILWPFADQIGTDFEQQMTFQIHIV